MPTAKGLLCRKYPTDGEGLFDEKGSIGGEGELSDKAGLREIALSVSTTQRSSKETVRSAIIALCQKNELSALEMANLLNRREQTVRQYIEELCREGSLTPKYKLKTHPNTELT